MSKVWLITGASRGIGAEIARAALAAGDRVVATGRNPQSVEEALGASDRLLAIGLDVTIVRQADEAVKAAIDKFGRIDVLVNNAGYALLGALEECSAEEVEAQFRTNVFGLLHVTRAVLPILRAQRSGHIFNISSLAGFYGDPGASSYCGTKFAVEGLSESLSREVAPLGIHVTIVEPGYFRTDFLSGASVNHAARVISDYDETAGKARRATAEVDGKQANDPKKLAQAFVTLTNAEKPPLRFTAGADAVELLEKSLSRKKLQLDQWRELSISFAHD
ncbi:oxidoreductase [Noviherbaspirillum sedimenti]|uniref:SDR family NAD(P)-dependent oxidoreductase n=1 Tax=Noviherbaspirillum sedimenti TaxID=2320865 RepID=A0A3A3G6A6_9BURK|nr:oxidoreductase [Noviherbaspirillum sedimenti]RJG03195.1 SDR family NAD(P)-dependent oxidoreductase [Noviherbaspirillum sedimenti]